MVDGSVASRLVVGGLGVSGRWIYSDMVNEPVGRLNTCQWVGGRLSVIGDLSVVGAFVRRLHFVIHFCHTF